MSKKMCPYCKKDITSSFDSDWRESNHSLDDYWDIQCPHCDNIIQVKTNVRYNHYLCTIEQNWLDTDVFTATD